MASIEIGEAFNPQRLTAGLSLTTCAMCGGHVRPGTLVLIGEDVFDGPCSIVAAASIASTVEDGGDESARDVSQAAAILDRAARSLRSRIAGRA